VSLDRSESLIHDAMDMFDQADDIESRVRGGETVTLDTGEKLRGESALPRIEAIRQSATLPLAASLAINLERIARALERSANPAGRGRLDFDEVADSELIAELARRHGGRSE